MSYRAGYQFSNTDVKRLKHYNVDFSKYNADELKALWLKTIEDGMHGICFSMYEDGQQPGDTITEAQVERRIKILKPHTKWVRSFSCIEGNEFVPKIAKKHGLKTLVGAWLSDDAEKNDEAIEALITLANPEKKVFPVFMSFIEINSSKLAPAQKARSPADFNIITVTFLFVPASVIVVANF